MRIRSLKTLLTLVAAVCLAPASFALEPRESNEPHESTEFEFGNTTEVSETSKEASAPASVEAAPITAKDLGQLLLLGFNGVTAKDQLELAIKAFKPGGIILFGRNIKSAYQVADLIHNAQKLSISEGSAPLFVAIDQEGGNVVRIKSNPLLPSALSLAKTGNPELSYAAGSATGSLLHTLGINMNLAPVLDISNSNKDKFLGTRSFGNSGSEVSIFASEFAKGLEQQKVLPIAKHFPGHGNATGDSHLVLPQSSANLKDVKSENLTPYRLLNSKLKKGWGVMLAHVEYPKIDTEKIPATYSQKISTDLLRGELGQEILAVTDDIQMAGAQTVGNVGERAVKALEAGADMIMIAWSLKTQREVYLAIEAAFKSGRLSEERIRSSLRRIQKLKAKYELDQIGTDHPTLNLLRAALQNPEFETLGQKVMASYVDASLKANRQQLELADEVVVFTPRSDFLNSFKSEFSHAQNRNPTSVAAEPKITGYLTRSMSFDDIKTKALRHDNATFVFYANGFQSLKLYENLPKEILAKAILVNVETSAALKSPKDYAQILYPYYRHRDLGAYSARIIKQLVRRR